MGPSWGQVEAKLGPSWAKLCDVGPKLSQDGAKMGQVGENLRKLMVFHGFWKKIAVLPSRELGAPGRRTAMDPTPLGELKP